MVAQTKAVNKEEVQGTEALVRSSAAEKDALSQVYEKLKRNLSDLMSKNQVLEQENATMRGHALKRAHRQVKVIDACPRSNILEGILTRGHLDKKGRNVLMAVQSIVSRSCVRMADSICAVDTSRP